VNSLISLFVKANFFKEGDMLVGGTEDDTVRELARSQLSDLKISTITENIFVEDRITEVLLGSIDRGLYKEISGLRLSELKAILLDEKGDDWIKKYSEALTSEVIAGVVKIMTDDELSQVSLKIYNTNTNSVFSNEITVGSRFHFGSRIQPNSPGDDTDEILISVLEGLCYGCGDVILGLNMACDETESVIRTEKLLHDIVERFKLPTRYSVLTDMFKQKYASEHTKVDVGFQSLSGTSKGLVGMLGCDIDELEEMCNSFNGLYFETGQGSEVTNGVADGVDMVTLESRCYGVARYLKKKTGKWMIVNDVAGFIGPEVFTTGKQLKRACLEDTVMSKLHGIVMGLDVCSTFHMGIHPSNLQQLTREIVSMAAPAYLMGVAGNADPMLGYLTTSYREHPQLRKLTGKTISSFMQQRLIEIGALKNDGTIDPSADRVASLYSVFHKSNGETRSTDELKKEALKKIRALQERGCDLCYGTDVNGLTPSFIRKNMETLFLNARKALYSAIEPSVIKISCLRPVTILTNSIDRDDYLAHPSSGEIIKTDDSLKLNGLYSWSNSKPEVQFIISDGLNADAISEHLRHVLPPLRKNLLRKGRSVSHFDLVVKNGRVRAGYHIGRLLQPVMIIHLIGERPGTGLNQLSAYITYGKDLSGKVIFDSDMDHSHTSAVCGIHPKGKPYKQAVEEIISVVSRGLEQKCTGVKLQ
jgi:ethanolamine ammonia-lyase large subunit